MTHGTCGGLLSAYIDDELSVQLRFDVEVHLSSCGACRSAVKELTAVRDYFSNAPYDSPNAPPPWAEIQRPLVQRDTNANARRTVVRGVAAAVAAVALIVITNDLGGRRKEPEPHLTEGRGADATSGVAGRELEEFIRINHEHLTPAMSSTADETMDVLNRAISDVRSSLAQNPGDSFLALYLARLERRRIAALRSIAATVRSRS